MTSRPVVTRSAGALPGASHRRGHLADVGHARRCGSARRHQTACAPPPHPGYDRAGRPARRPPLPAPGYLPPPPRSGGARRRVRSARNHDCPHTRCRASRSAAARRPGRARSESRPDTARSATSAHRPHRRPAGRSPGSRRSRKAFRRSRRTPRDAVRSSGLRACSPSGSSDIRRSPVRTRISRRSLITASAPRRRSSSRGPAGSTPITSANPPARAAVTPSSVAVMTAHRPGRTASRFAASTSAAASGGVARRSSSEPTPASRSCFTSVSSAAGSSRSNSTASWRRGSMVTDNSPALPSLAAVAVPVARLVRQARRKGR